MTSQGTILNQDDIDIQDKILQKSQDLQRLNPKFFELESFIEENFQDENQNRQEIISISEKVNQLKTNFNASAAHDVTENFNEIYNITEKGAQELLNQIQQISDQISHQKKQIIPNQ